MCYYFRSTLGLYNFKFSLNLMTRFECCEQRFRIKILSEFMRGLLHVAPASNKRSGLARVYIHCLINILNPQSSANISLNGTLFRADHLTKTQILPGD